MKRLATIGQYNEKAHQIYWEKTPQNWYFKSSLWTKCTQVRNNCKMNRNTAIEIEEDKMLIKLAEYKTVDIHNSGKLMFFPFEYVWLMFYVTFIRSELKAINTNFIFVSRNGIKIALGDISSPSTICGEKQEMLYSKSFQWSYQIILSTKSASTFVTEADITNFLQIPCRMVTRLQIFTMQHEVCKWQEQRESK